MSKLAAIAAQVVDIQNDRQHKGFVKVTLHIPAELGAQLTESLGWPTYTTPVPVALARLNPEAKETKPTTADTPTPAPQDPSARATKNPLTTRAAILCNDPLFHRYLDIHNPLLRQKQDRISATEHLRQFCKVGSRKDILPGTEAATRLDLLESDFVCWRDKDKFVEAL